MNVWTEGVYPDGNLTVWIVSALIIFPIGIISSVFSIDVCNIVSKSLSIPSEYVSPNLSYKIYYMSVFYLNV